MVIDNDLLDKLAYLARLEFTEHERADMLYDLNEIVTWVEQLDELTIDNNLAIDQCTVLQEDRLREDIALNTLTHEQALTLAPSSDSNYLRAPL